MLRKAGQQINPAYDRLLRVLETMIAFANIRSAGVEDAVAEGIKEWER
jgi:hypothetical protein